MVEGRTDAPDLSVIITCHFEEQSIDEFHDRLDRVLGSLGRSYEIVFVNDGSTDGTLRKLHGIFQTNPRVHAVVDLFRNSGQQAAITAGMERARGKAMLLMDSDLQLAPEEIPMLVATYDKGYDIVSGYRANRRDSFFRRVPSSLANVIMRKASRSSFRDFGCTFKIYNATLVRACGLGSHHIMSNVELARMSERRAEVAVTHHPRKYGRSGFTFAKLWRYNADNLVILSQRPFQLLGALCLAVAALFTVRVVSGFFWPGRILGEVTNGLVLNAIVIGLLVTLAVLSVIGEFTIRTFMTSQRLPAYIVRDVLTR